MKNSKDRRQTESMPVFTPLADLSAPTATDTEPLVEVEDGVTFISEVVPIEDAAPAAPIPDQRGMTPENCQFCGARNLIDIRRNYYCLNCGHETSK